MCPATRLPWLEETTARRDGERLSLPARCSNWWRIEDVDLAIFPEENARSREASYDDDDDAIFVVGGGASPSPPRGKCRLSATRLSIVATSHFSEVSTTR